MNQNMNLEKPTLVSVPKRWWPLFQRLKKGSCRDRSNTITYTYICGKKEWQKMHKKESKKITTILSISKKIPDYPQINNLIIHLLVLFSPLVCPIRTANCLSLMLRQNCSDNNFLLEFINWYVIKWIWKKIRNNFFWPSWQNYAVKCPF
jgi:hypothetical protein